jgi:AraC-like DNA-binding protein
MSNKEFELKLWKPIENENVILSKSSFNNFGFDKHIHEEYAIGVVSNGFMDLSFKGTNKSINKKYIMTFNPDTMHSNWSINKNSYTQMAIYFHPTFLAKFLEESFNDKEIFFKDKLLENESLSNELTSLINDYENNDLLTLEYECRIIELFNKILTTNADSNQSISSKNSWSSNIIVKAKEYMQDNINENITLDDIAQELKLSKFHFSRIFKEETHFSPHTYLMIKRLEKAKQELQNGISISQVAQLSGFSDQSHLNKRFKKYLGVTPLKYRNFFK